MNNKVCILTDSLGSGGAEKMAANLSVSLSNKGYDVTVVSMLDDIVYNIGGTLYNFGLVKAAKSKYQAFLEFKNYFKKQGFDVIIDHRMRPRFLKEWLFSRFVFKNCHVIYCTHHYDLSYYFSFPNNPLLSKLAHVRKSTFVSVSNEVKVHLKQTLGIDSILIYNYVLSSEFGGLENISTIDDNDYIISVGRLVKVKQFDVLIASYKNSRLIENNIGLRILGEGSERTYLETLIDELGLKDHVKLMGFQDHPFKWVKNAKALVLASSYEGFPMVLIEALALKTPMISFDCKTGPNEIIKHELNGLLVPAQNEQLLTEAMNKLLLGQGFYKEVKKHIENDPFPFSEEQIVQEWVELIGRLD